MNAQPVMAVASAPLSIQALSDALEASDTQAALFSSDQPNNLARLIQAMENKGYQVSAPVKAAHAPRVSGRVAWQLTISIPALEPTRAVVGALLFYVPEDVY